MNEHTPELYATETRTHKNTSKAIKDIAAGQEILVQYGNAKWFENKNIPYSDIDYACTMWRPDLRPLPCRQNILIHKAAGRRSFAVLATIIPPGTVMEISLCVEVSVIAIDQFPYLWDFVIMDAATQAVCACVCTCVCMCVCAYTR